MKVKELHWPEIKVALKSMQAENKPMRLRFQRGVIEQGAIDAIDGRREGERGLSSAINGQREEERGLGVARRRRSEWLVGVGTMRCTIHSWRFFCELERHFMIRLTRSRWESGCRQARNKQSTLANARA